MNWLELRELLVDFANRALDEKNVILFLIKSHGRFGE